MTTKTRQCTACGRPLPPGSNAGRTYCPKPCETRKRPAPAVYRFVAPDGRCYIGSVSDISKRDRHGLSRSNPWIDEAMATHSPETWTFEVLEELPPGCPKETLRRAEQQRIERLRSWMPEHGFNIFSAWWFGTTPGVLAGRARQAEQTRKMMRRSWSLRRQSLPLAVKAGKAAARSDKHISKKRTAGRTD